MKKIFVYFIIWVSLITFVVTPGCLKKEIVYNYTYSIEIRAPYNTNYTIFMPVPLCRGSVSFVVNKLKVVAGEPLFTLVNTSYGQALNITASTSSEKIIKLEAKATSNKFPFHNLSMEILNESKHNEKKHYVYISILDDEIENASFYVYERAYHKYSGQGPLDGGFVEASIIDWLSGAGWQKINGTWSSETA